MKEKKIRLGDIAYARSGDKGSSANIGVIAKKEVHWDFIQKHLTAKLVENFFKKLNVHQVKRYELPNLWALNFVLEGVLAGGGSLSLRTDAQGKALGQALLEIELELEIEL